MLRPGRDRQGDDKQKTDERGNSFLLGWACDHDNGRDDPCKHEEKNLPSGEPMSIPGAKKRADSTSRVVEEESFSFGVIMCGAPRLGLKSFPAFDCNIRSRLRPVRPPAAGQPKKGGACCRRRPAYSRCTLSIAWRKFRLLHLLDLHHVFVHGENRDPPAVLPDLYLLAFEPDSLVLDGP